MLDLNNENENKNMKKLLPLLVVGILVLIRTGASAASFCNNKMNIQWKQVGITSTSKSDMLDQSQPTMDWFILKKRLFNSFFI